MSCLSPLSHACKYVKNWVMMNLFVLPNIDFVTNAGAEVTVNLVVVVNHCFTSLFGTKGLLSDIIIR